MYFTKLFVVSSVDNSPQCMQCGTNGQLLTSIFNNNLVTSMLLRLGDDKRMKAFW